MREKGLPAAQWLIRRALLPVVVSEELVAASISLAPSLNLAAEALCSFSAAGSPSGWITSARSALQFRLKGGYWLVRMGPSRDLVPCGANPKSASI